MTDLQKKRKGARYTALLTPLSLGGLLLYAATALAPNERAGVLLRLALLAGFTAVLFYLFFAKLWPTLLSHRPRALLKSENVLTFLVYFCLLPLLWCFLFGELGALLNPW